MLPRNLKIKASISQLTIIFLTKDIPFVKKGLYRVKFNARRMNHNRFDEFIYSAPTTQEAENWIKKNKNDKQKRIN